MPLGLGEHAHRYLGRQHRLNVGQGDAKSVELARGSINVNLVEALPKRRKKSS